jgi:hypothetical protein
MNVGRKYSGLDIFVVIVYGLAFLIVIFNICFVDPLSKKENIVIDYVNYSVPIMSVFWVSVLLTWIIHGGADSRLWYWLPPLCFFFWCNRWQRWAFVILTVVAGLFGMASSYLESFW